jgi:Pacifastin inhibitor (LCMII)/Kazal-type serine protease inhibitor domain
MTNRFAARWSWGQRAGAAGLGLWAAVMLGACNGYDLGDVLGAIGGGHGNDPGHGGPGHGDPGHGGPGHGGHGHDCVLDGEQHHPGESFPASDGCNTCSCGEDGQVACTLRFCATTCGGIAGLGCADGEYCSFPAETQCGAGDQTGFCAAQPEVCTLELNPVCGCDGATYGNACAAASVGVSVAAEGECNTENQCNTDSDCPVPPCACLDEDGDGQCDNQCPVPVCREGACSVAAPDALQLGDSCGGFRVANSSDCDTGMFCQHQAGALCGAADAPGECVLIPTACRDILAPVCGCDGQTYGNSCEAAVAQVGILDLGECP